MRERLSGAVILVALAVIFLPMLFDDPVPREERPQPMLSIEAPLEVDRVEVDDPQPPAGLDDRVDGSLDSSSDESSGERIGAASNDATGQVDDAGASEAGVPDADEPSEPQVVSQQPSAAPNEPEVTSNAPEGSDGGEQGETAVDPIAELARAAEAKRAAAGEWSVQAGSFGEPGNAERLEQQLEAKGFNAYRRPRGNDLTAVYVGPFASAEEGERARSELKAKANLQGLVVRMSP
ncbi:SPOR domain-containing protein [Halomonas sp. YLGW01]|uniref:SPOR domain-containing protein n=1 Tax=Halomonas sp. YLGW01 TaxID=2773308 RepID=UPI001F5B5C5E|nr:SPOR domain-containing protein [Halomonas sp. YLGW01]